MNKDLENTLNELGPEYRSVVDRLRAPFATPRTLHSAPRTLHSAPRTLHSAPRTLHSAPRTLHSAPCTLHPAPRTPHYLIAASLLAVVSLAIWNFTSTTLHSSLLPLHSSPAPAVYTVAYAADEFALRAILESQQSDGSWSNDYLTMQNAAALRKASDEASLIAYKRAVRYLRAKGLGPLPDDEFRRRSVRVFPAG